MCYQYMNIVNQYKPVAHCSVNTLYYTRVKATVANLTIQQRGRGNEQSLFKKSND